MPKKEGLKQEEGRRLTGAVVTPRTPNVNPGYLQELEYHDWSNKAGLFSKSARMLYEMLLLLLLLLLLYRLRYLENDEGIQQIPAVHDVLET